MTVSIDKIKSFIMAESDGTLVEDQSVKQGEAYLSGLLRGKNVPPKDKESIMAFKNAGAAQRLKLLAYCGDISSATRVSCDAVRLAYSKGSSSGHGRAELGSPAKTDADIARISRFVKDHEKDKSFSYTVNSFAESKGLKNSDIYRNACLSRQDFSRIVDPKRKSAVRRPFVWSVAIGLRLNLDETDVLLYSAGYIRKKSDFDLVMTYCITNGIYNITEINLALDELHLPLLPQTYIAVTSKDPFSD